MSGPELDSAVLAVVSRAGGLEARQVCFYLGFQLPIKASLGRLVKAGLLREHKSVNRWPSPFPADWTYREGAGRYWNECRPVKGFTLYLPVRP